MSSIERRLGKARLVLVLLRVSTGLGLSTGCGLTAAPLPAAYVNVCAADTECRTGARCDEALGMCVAIQNPDYVFDLEVALVRGGAGAAATVLRFQDLQPQTPPVPIQVDVPLPVAATGSVRVASGEQVSANVTFTAVRGRARQGWSISTRATPTDFATQLVPGTTYDVLVEPVDSSRQSLPPLRASLEVGSTGVNVPIIYDRSSFRTIEGSLVDEDGSPVLGLSIRATDARGQTISSVFTSDETNMGVFQIAMPRSSEAFDLRIATTGTPSPEEVFPSLTLPSAALLPDEQNRVRVLVPRITNRILYEGRVELPASRGIQPLAGARVHLRSNDVVDTGTGLIGSLDIETTTNTDGVFSTWVLPGTYWIEITPTSNDSLAVVAERHELRSTTGALRGQVFRVAERSVLGGTVRTGGGIEVDGARIRAEALGLRLSTSTPELGRLNRSVETTSGLLGEFRLPLDVGAYDLIVEPPLGSGYAWTVDPELSVENAQGSVVRAIRLEAPVAFRGLLARPDSQPVPDAAVSAFVVMNGREVEVARARTSATGDFVLLLPANLAL